MLKHLLLVGIGGGIGSMLRYICGIFLPAKYFPYSTLAVNIVGSFIIGLVIAFSVKDESFNQNWKLFLATGICGGFTTFSAFAMENLQLMQSGKYLTAIIYIIASITLGIIAAFSGFKLITYNS